MAAELIMAPQPRITSTETAGQPKGKGLLPPSTTPAIRACPPIAFSRALLRFRGACAPGGAAGARHREDRVPGRILRQLPEHLLHLLEVAGGSGVGLLEKDLGELEAVEAGEAGGLEAGFGDRLGAFLEVAFADRAVQQENGLADDGDRRLGGLLGAGTTGSFTPGPVATGPVTTGPKAGLRVA